MIRYRREDKRIHKSKRLDKTIWGALALLILLGLLLQNVAGTAYYSLLMEPTTTVATPPVELQQGTAGTSTIYENKTSALVSVSPSGGGGGTDVEDYVDNNDYDEDGSADKGTHSNFTAQQYGPDLINDTLTEENTGGQGSEWRDCNDWDSTYDAWSEAGDPPYLDAQDYSANYIMDVSGNAKEGWFYFANTTFTGTLSVNISIYCNNDDGPDNDYANVYVDYTGSGAGTDVGDIANHTNWQYDNISLGLHTVSEVNNLRVYFEYKKSGGGDNVRLDHARIGIASSDSYELDLEVQWTSVDYDEAYEYLCIYGGTMGAENIRVDAWSGSDWENVFTDLNAGWNNVSVASYLDSSNFTVRFRGGSETGDVTQHTWNIDAALLHVWSGDEGLGSATTVTADAIDRSVSYGYDRAVLRTTDANNTLHLFQLDYSNNGHLWWWKSIDNGGTWSKQISSWSDVDCTSFSVTKDSNNYIHLVYARYGAIKYIKVLYNATSWPASVDVDTNNRWQADIAIAPYNESWIYVAVDHHTTSGGSQNKVYVKYSDNGGTSFSDAGFGVISEQSGYTAGTFPSVTIDNTKGTYGHIYVTWFKGDQTLYIKNGTIASDGSVTWRDMGSDFAITNSMSTQSITKNTNMMHSAMYLDGKYRVVYCVDGIAQYKDWDEILMFSQNISLATVSHYPSITYDWDNYIYVFYMTNATDSKFDIRYQRSEDTTPSAFGDERNVTSGATGDNYVSAKLGGDNNRLEFAWVDGTVGPYSVKFNSLSVAGGDDDFDHVLKAVEVDSSNWKVRLNAYDDSGKSRLDNLTIYIYDGSNSTQIIILNGLYDQQTGSLYDLAANGTIYFAMHVETSTAGTSYVNVYLEIYEPNTTVYARYIITFKIT